MSAQNKVSHDLADNADIFSLLSAAASPVEKPAVKAQWAVLRISPDLATGEVLNVGICILYRRKIHVRLLPNAKPFEVLYGQQGKENFSFLLTLIGQYMENQNKLEITISPQVSISKSSFVAGNSVEEISDRLYHSMITLDFICRSKDIVDKPRNNISTERLRNRIHASFYKTCKNFTEEVWHNEENPIEIPREWGNQIRLHHIQMLVKPNWPNDIIRLASFVSTDYLKTDFSKLHLFQAKQDIELAINSITEKEKKTGLFIYRPDSLPRETADKIDTTIDNIHWLFSKSIAKDKWEMQVESCIDKLESQAIAFAT